MSRKPKGTVWRSPDGSELKVRVTVTDDKGETYRPWVSLNPKFDDEKARKVALRAAEAERGKPRPRKMKGLTVSGTPSCDEYFEKLWTPSREGRLKSPKTDRYRWRLHIKPIIGEKAIGDVTPDDLRDVVQALDEKVADEEIRFGANTAKACWSIVTKMFADACGSKIKELRLLKTNPTTDVAPPDPPEEPEKQWLFPRELRQLLACSDVPLEWRRLYATATFCYSRPGETLALLWEKGIDLEHNMVRINRSWDSEEGEFQEFTKTGDSRHFALEPVIRPMLQAMAREAKPGTDLVFKTEDKLAETLRAHLLAAGVDRHSLHVRRPGALLMRFHDLRATGVTYMAMRGDTDEMIRERAGHADFKTTQMYIRRGHQAHGASIGDPFAPLPEELPGIVKESSGKELSGGVSGDSDSGNDDAAKDLHVLSADSGDVRAPRYRVDLDGPVGLPTTRATVKDDSGRLISENLDAEELEFLAAILEDGERSRVAEALVDNAAWRAGGTRA